MYSRLQLVRKYLSYFVSAANGKGHGIHSPFVFAFVTKVLNDKRPAAAYAQVESLRRSLLKDVSLLDVDDRGAGSGVLRQRRRRIADIARTAAKPKKFGQLLFRIVQYYQAENILELGTSLGITTAYLSRAHPKTRVVTIEGAHEVAACAKKNFEAMELSHVQLIEGDFDAVLPGLLEHTGPLDLAFVDGNHRKDPTLRYFNMLRGKAHPGSILIFDDIHWSTEMEDAWRIIQSDPSVTCTIDLFFIGLVFFRDEIRSKQHFVIRF